MTDLRCDKGKIKFGEVDDQHIEFKCKSRFCGWRPGLVIIHQFNHQGELIKTIKFAEPVRKGR